MTQLALLEQAPVLRFPALVDQELYRARLEAKYVSRMHERLRLGKLVTYVNNRRVPLLGLYRYKEAFALSFVEEFLGRFGLGPGDLVFDPFCGMGTTLFGAMLKGIAAMGVDRLPLPVFLANTIPQLLSLQAGTLHEAFEGLRARAASAEPAAVADDVAIMGVAFPEGMLLKLRRWKGAIAELPAPLSDIFLLLFLSVLEECSFTSKDGQFLRLLRDKHVTEPEVAMERKVYAAEKDLAMARDLGWTAAQPTLAAHLGDTRDLRDLTLDRPPTAIITSPPYPNRYDYTRTYSLELCFHFVRNFGELRALRSSILRSHIETRIASHEVAPHPAVEEVVTYLQDRRDEINNPRIPDMLIGYFVDMEKAIGEWARVLARSAHVALVVDNVRFEGQMLPVDLILSEMAEEAGFEVQEIIVARYKGNSSQQMGKYGRVPVRESVLVWRKL